MSLLKEFRISNFRSIVDSGWVPFSQDGVTVLVGQNESGKTSVLECLYLALSEALVSEDDIRIDSPYPKVEFKIAIESEDFDPQLTYFNVLDTAFLKKSLKENNNLNIIVSWARNNDNQKWIKSKSLADGEQEDKLATAIEKRINVPDIENKEAELQDTEDNAEPLSVDSMINYFFERLPGAVLFNANSGLLPNSIDINEKNLLTGEGVSAARNFLNIAGIDLAALVSSPKRTIEHTLKKANEKITKDFNYFWSQTVGKNDKISLKCSLDYYPDTSKEKPGKPHLVFWIGDRNVQLYPKQRSQGVRWFISFYLQIKASEISQNRRIFFLDEPGASLHAKAQADVIKLINKLSSETQIFYTTHSPYMLEYQKLFRVHAVQRDEEDDESPSHVISAHRLGSASTDTLSPIITAMGVDLSSQTVIKKTNNVILEEISGYYYLQAFWKLQAKKSCPSFIAATGVNNIETLANMFRGWGLDFIIVIDDDKQAREVYKRIKLNFCGNDDTVASYFIYRIRDCHGIEDIFDAKDFYKYIACEKMIKEYTTNTDYIKEAKSLKSVMAYKFLMQVEQGHISWRELQPKTQEGILKLINAIEERITDARS